MTELKKLKTNYNQRKADSVDNNQPSKKRKRWQFHCKWKRKKREESHLDQVMPESDSLKRLKRKDPDDAEEESSEPDPLTVEDVPNTANSNSIPQTKNFLPIFLGIYHCFFSYIQIKSHFFRASIYHGELALICSTRKIKSECVIKLISILTKALSILNFM